MKSASSATRAILAAGQYFRADLYTIELLSGTTVRYTTGDLPITVAGSTYATGLVIRRGSLRQSVGLEVSTLDLDIGPQTDWAGAPVTVSGVPFLAAIRSGLFDGARVTWSKLFLSNWGDLSPGAVPWFQGRINNARAGRASARLVVHADTETLNVAMPRNILQSGCLHTLYDAGCGLSEAAFTVNGTVTATGPNGVVRFTTSLGNASGYFDLGRITFTSGANFNVSRPVKAYVSTNGVVELIAPLPTAPAVGDGFAIRAGCDKKQATCSSKFSNLARFRGFPYIPVPETLYDGGAVAQTAPAFGYQGSIIGGSEVSAKMLQAQESPSSPTTPPVLSGGSPPLVTLTPGTRSMGIALSMLPVGGRTIVDVEVQRLINGIWVTISTPRPPRVSEIPPRSTAAATKWVHPSGTLGGNSAYTTLQAAEAASVPGDVIDCAGTFNTYFLITRGGTSTNRILWRAYDPANPPVISGQSTVNPPGWTESGFATGSTSLLNVQAEYVTVDGFRVQDSKQHGIAVGACNNNGAFFNVTDPWYRGIEVFRCVVSSASQGLIMWKAENPRFAGNDFSRCQNGTYWDTAAGNPEGWGSAVSMAGRDVWFVENIVRQTMGEGVHIGHHINVTAGNNQAAGTKGFTIRGNTFYDCWSDPIYATIGSDGVIEENLVFMSNDPRFWYARSNGAGYPQYGIGVGGELGATFGVGQPWQYTNPTTVYDSDYNGIRDVKIRNNIINGANKLFSFKRFADAHKTKNIEVEHNTIFCTKGAFASVYQALENIQTSANEMTGVKWRNNAVLVSDPSDVFTTWNALGAGKVVAGNFFSHTPPSDLSSPGNIIDAGATVIGDKNYSATSSGWPNPVAFDLSKAAPYYVGDSISPLVNAANSVGVLRDFYGRTRPTASGRADIGAISLSMANDAAFTESGLDPSTSYQYRARYRMDSLTWTAYSLAATETTPAGGAGAEVAPAFLSASSGVTDTAGDPTATIPAPAGLVPGKYVALVVMVTNNSGSGAWGPVTWPPGFAEQVGIGADASAWNKLFVATKLVTASEPPTYDVTYAEAGGPYRVIGAALAYSDPNSTPLDAAPVPQRNESNASVVVAPSVTPSNANQKRLVCIYGISDGNATTGGRSLAPPAGQTERIEVVAGSGDGQPFSRFMVADEVYASASPTGTRSATISGGDCESLAITLLLRGRSA
jgi:uncharacterized phage protein (TIGR02218 family)